MRVLIIDDHPVFRQGIKTLLGQLPHVIVVGEAEAARPALAMLESTRPDLVLVDLLLPGMDGLSAIREIRRRTPTIRLIMLTVSAALVDPHEALAAGAHGYVLKDEPAEALLEAIERVSAGRCYLSSRLREAGNEHTPAPSGAHPLDRLSEREREVFRLAVRGVANDEIARELRISRKTVESHQLNLRQKLDLRGPADLVRFADAHDLVPGRPRR